MIPKQSARVDPVTLEVLRNALPAITNEMSYDLQRTSYNMVIYEMRDYCCGLLDVEGRLISQNIGGVSHFIADLGVVIQDGVAHFGRDGFAPGDVIIHNHQRVAGQHLNNVCIYTPFFFEGELLAFAIVRAHWVDVGGMTTGFGSRMKVQDPWMEGLQLDQLKLYERGVLDQKLNKMIRDNIRFPESSMGDLRSQMAACRIAERRLEELFQRYGRNVIMASVERIFDDSEAECRAIVSRMPDGVYEAESMLEDETPNDPLVIKVRVVVEGGNMTIDLSQCSKQRAGADNSRTKAGAYIAYKAITAPTEPVNEGSFRAATVVIPEGSFMMATYPANMAGWSIPLPTVVDTVLKALAPAMPDFIPAAHHGAMGGGVTFIGFDPRRQKRFLMHTANGAGWGGRPWEDGESASCSICQGDVRNSPIENVELKCPVVIESRALRPDSGGAGKYRGGMGAIIQVRNLTDGLWKYSDLTSRRNCPRWGLWGGKPGAQEEAYIRLAGEQEFKKVEALEHRLPVGSTAILRTSAGGGWGDPLDRDPEKVRMDVLEEYVSLQNARDQYGVILDPSNLEIDVNATNQLRAELRAIA